MTSANGLLTDVPGLPERAERNLAEHACHLLRGRAGATVKETANLVVADSRLHDDAFNIVAAARLSPQTVAAQTSETVRELAATGRPFCWWVGPGSAPADLGTHLEAAGAQPVERETAMWGDVRVVPAEPGGGLEVRRVASPGAVDDYARVYAAGCTLPAAAVRRFFSGAAERILRPDAAARLLVGYASGRPVGSAEVFVHAGVAGLYSCVVLPAARGHGHGRSMTLAALRCARGTGCPVVIAQATVGGAALLRAAGLRAYGHFTGYAVRPPDLG